MTEKTKFVELSSKQNIVKAKKSEFVQHKPFSIDFEFTRTEAESSPNIKTNSKPKSGLDLDGFIR